MPQCLWEPVTILLHGIDHVGIGNGAQMNRLHLRQSSWAAMRESFDELTYEANRLLLVFTRLAGQR